MVESAFKTGSISDEVFNLLKAFDSRDTKSALEIVMTTKKPVPKLKISNSFDILQIGIAKSSDELKALIHKRLIKRLKNDAMIKEVKKLHKLLSWKRLEEFGLEYRFVAQYLQNKISYQKMAENIQIESEHYAKRQMTWFKKDKKIKWIKNCSEANSTIKSFMQKMNRFDN